MVNNLGTLRELSSKVAIVGVGETDYGADWQAARTKEESYSPPDSTSLAAKAFQRAILDSGLEKNDLLEDKHFVSVGEIWFVF